MRQLTIDVPDFAAMADADVEQHVLTRLRDGRWSRQTRQLLATFGTDKLELNEAWAQNWTDWTCPACHRHKLEIARLTEHGVLLCQLDWHHDHLEDHARALMRAHLPVDLPEHDLGMRKRAITAALVLIERFAETLLCNDCNAADGAMKAQLGAQVPSWFSFRPSEIAQFIRPAPNRPHMLHIASAQGIWEAVQNDVAARCAFANDLGARIAAGDHDREAAPHAERHSNDLALFWKLGCEAATARNKLDGLSESLVQRSRSTAGRWSASTPKPSRKAEVPSAQQFALFDAQRTASSRWWRESGESWRCPCCARSKFEIIRRSNKGSWTGAIMAVPDFVPETDPDSLRRRAMHHAGPIVLGSHRQIGICQDCRQILSDATTIRPGVGSDCLALPDIARLTAPATPHARHCVASTAIAALIDASGDWIAAVSDYWNHARQAHEIAFGHYKMMVNTGLSAEGAREILIAKLAHEGQLPATDTDTWFDWHMREDARLARIKRDDAPDTN